MNGSTAFHLKQIMSAEHLSLTQAAKQIGISPSSMRKVLKDAKMSQPLMFKVNRFIDAHNAIVHTKPGELPTAQAKPASKNTTADQPAKADQKPAKKPAAQKASAKASAQKPAKKQSAQQKPTRQKTTQQRAPKAAEAAKPNHQPAAKKTTAKRPAKPARFTIHQIDGAPIVPEAKLAQAQTNATLFTPQTAEQPKTQADQPANVQKSQSNPQQRRRRVQKRAEELSLAGVGSLEPKQPQKAAQPASDTATPAPKAKPTPQPAPAKQPQKPAAATPAPETAVQPAVPDKAAPAAVKPVPAEAKPAATPAPQAPVATTAKALQLFVDESFVHGNDYQRNMYIGVTVVDEDDDDALKQFADTLYPFGWQPGDEVKARGKNHDQIAAMLTKAHGDHADNFVAFSPQSDTGNFAMGFGVLYPYLATILRILSLRKTLPAKIRIVLDRRNEIQDEQLGVAARMLNSYVKAQTGQDVMFMLRTSDSKSTIGIQYSDFSAHAALTFTTEQLAACGITRLPDLGSQVGDQITLFSMIGLQKYLLDDHTAVAKPSQFENPVLIAAERLFNLANKATTLTQVPDETLTQAKLVINQLLQITPASVNGAINKMPFQNWYDMCARASALLHYTDASLPAFEIDPDAMQIAQDALNNMYNLLAAAK
ncbi:DUF3800 domain-containing protein [Lacticaseibacillus baoqingensis]|uniref:DUF3800 domain-containing protein n=1 Tax=Lacticaseibacillus baoqingensis TaxID=2486013 RepID=A0ABW4E459_9LACO|nr:DUF3800 domain-containing protein [Lacticaseibacillus baoqingensis]